MKIQQIDKKTSKFVTNNANSGDEILSYVSNEKKYIIKRSVKNIDRLAKSAELQNNYVDSTNYTFAVPIISLHKTNEIVEIRMPFINGFSGQNLYVYIRPTKLLQISEQLSKSVLNRFNQSSESYSANQFKSIIENKMVSIKFSILENQISKKVSDFTSKIEDFILSEIDYVNIECPKSSIHGDITFSNIVFDYNSDKIWLIDFLPSFIDSPLIDIAKLIQEFKYSWSARYLGSGVKTAANIFGVSAMSRLLSGVLPSYGRYLKIFSIINIYRILPYTKDETTLSWVISALEEELKCEY